MLILAVALLPLVQARGPYRLQAIAQFGRQWRCAHDPLGNIGEALQEALKAMKDSGGDGCADVLEVFAGLPTASPW